MGGGGGPFGAPISPWSGTSPASHAGPCHPGLPPCAAVLVPVFLLSSSGALVCFVRGCCFFIPHRSPPVSSPGTSVCPLSPPHVPSPPPRFLAPFLGGWGRRGWGGGGRPRCPSSGVSTSQARRMHEARHLSLCRGGGHAAWLPSSPFPPCVRPPGAPPAGACTARASLKHGRVVRPAPSLRCLPTLPLCPREGGRYLPLPSFAPDPWGGGGVWGGGAGACRLPFVARKSQARRKHGAGTRRGTRPSAGGGGHASWLPSSPFPPCARTPGGPPAGACTARALFGHGRVVRPARSYRCLPTLPRCPRGGGKVAFRPPPYPHPPPSGGRGWVGGGGAPTSSPLRCTHVAGTTQARHKHGVRHLAAAGGGGVPLGLPALLHGIGSAPQDHQPLLPLGGSRHVSAWCSVSRACSLLCPYLLEEVRTRVETDDEEVRAAGRTYRTPRRLLAPSAALVKGRAPVSAPNSPGGADCPSSPWCPCIHFRAAWYRCRGIGPLEVAATKRPGALVPRASATAERDGGP